MMDGFDPASSFGPEIASRYDDEELRGDEAETVDFLISYAGGTRALELAIGTGRVALPLHARGIPVDGIELSAAMVERLRQKPGGADLPVVLGDMSRSGAPHPAYRLIYLVYNTIYNLLTQDDQVRCFANAARHLARDGHFVVEAGAPWAWLRGNQFVNVERMSASHVVLDVNRYDPATQILEEQHVRLGAEGIRLDPIACRLIWPGEMDLMARLAGLRRVERWGGWCHEPFTAASERYVSVYAPA